MLNFFGLLVLVGCGKVGVDSKNEFNASLSQSDVQQSKHHQSAFSERSRSLQLQTTLQNITKFSERSAGLADAPTAQLQEEMAELNREIDDMAIEQNLLDAGLILNRVASAQQIALNVAELAQRQENKGVWLAWSEHLLLSRNALQHTFSELRLNQLERAIDSGNIGSALDIFPQLNDLIHPDHERRVVALLRAQPSRSELRTALIRLLGFSKGPLARLNLFQRFINDPSLELANALGEAGLPRASDLIGDSALGEKPSTTPDEVNRSIARSALTANNLSLIRFPTSTSTSIASNPAFTALRDFPSKWKELRNYLESLRTIPQQYEKLRDKWHDMHALVQQKILSLDVSDEEKIKLQAKLLQSFGSRMNPETLSYWRSGVEFRDGDILLVQNGTTGGLWETFTQSKSILSHLQMVYFSEDGLPYTLEMNFGQILRAPLELKADRFTVVRLKQNSPENLIKLHHAMTGLGREDIKYDFKFDSRDHSKLYCSELAAATFAKANIAAKPVEFATASARSRDLLEKAGIKSDFYYAQGSYIASNDFSVIGQSIASDPRDLIRDNWFSIRFLSTWRMQTVSSSAIIQRPSLCLGCRLSRRQ